MNIKNVSNFVVRTETLNQYLKEINSIYPYTAQEERDIFVQYHDATDEKEKLAIRNEIILHNQRFIFAVAKRYNSTDLVCPLINVGNIGLYEAIDLYEWERGFRFYSFASRYVQRAINGYFLKENLTVRPTNNTRVAAKVKKIKNEFFLTNGREPSTIEVIDILGEKYNIFISDPADVCGVTMESIDANISDDSDSSTFEDSPEWNVATATRNEYEKTIEDENNSYIVSEVLKVLNERERTVIKMLFGIGYDREYEIKEVANKMGLSSECIRLISIKAQKKMRTAAEKCMTETR